jgi:hypothetical protein
MLPLPRFLEPGMVIRLGTVVGFAETDTGVIVDSRKHLLSYRPGVNVRTAADPGICKRPEELITLTEGAEFRLTTIADSALLVGGMPLA